MSNFVLKKVNDEWTLEIDGKTVPDYKCKNLGIVYKKSQDGCSILKHGDWDFVFDFVWSYREELKKYGMEELANMVLIVNATKASEEDVNKVLNTSIINENNFLKLDCEDDDVKILKYWVN